MELDKFNKVLDSDYSIEFETFIGEGFDLFKKNALLLLGFIVLQLAMAWGILAISLPYGMGFLAFNLISTFLHIGLYISLRMMRNNEEVSFNHFFDGFKLNALQVVGLSSVSMALTILMILFSIANVKILILLFLYPIVAYTFSIPIFSVVQNDFWGCMEMSRKIITKKWFGFLGFLILLGLINIVGSICFLVGLIVTIPVTYCAIYVAFEYICRVNTVDDFDQKVASLGQPDADLD